MKLCWPVVDAVKPTVGRADRVRSPIITILSEKDGAEEKDIADSGSRSFNLARGTEDFWALIINTFTPMFLM